MEVEIRPQVGVGPFRLGMSVAQARGTFHASGPFRPVADDTSPGQIVLRHEESGLDVVLGFTRGALSGVELFRFRNEDADVRILFDGLDVFRTPSEDLFEQLALRGHVIEEDDLGFDALPELKVILANQSSHEQPVDEEGDPLYYDYVLVADWI
ncbi:hypothetical protein ACFZCP_21890 [Streptomyces sp. NPDC007971]|uniref:hypothetical protein n=1 Tax=Streptomyces sp. NPDC007971 TaxID=3364799 RepID=UPI0036E803F7